MRRRKSLSKKMKNEIIEKSDGKCFYCGITLDDDLIEYDHVHPFSKGGEDNFENLVAACYLCNSYKSDKTLEEFRESLINFKEKHKKTLVGVGYHVRIARNYKMFEKCFDASFYFEQKTEEQELIYL